MGLQNRTGPYLPGCIAVEPKPCQKAGSPRNGSAMSELIGLFNLLAPFFGLIGLGFFCGKVVRQPEAGLAWMQFFLIYVALPCLFYRLIADQSLDELTNWAFVAATTIGTFTAFSLSFAAGWRHTRDLPQSVM